MKYYNSELESIKRDHFDEKELNELLNDVRQSIEKSIQKLNGGTRPAMQKGYDRIFTPVLIVDFSPVLGKEVILL